MARPSTAAFLDPQEPTRRALLEALLETVRRHLPEGIEEHVRPDRVEWFVPHSLFAPGYHCDPSTPLPFGSLMSPKGHAMLSLFALYVDGAEGAAWVARRWKESGRKLDAGKGCLRFKKLEDVPLDAVGEAVGRHSVAHFVASYSAQFPGAAKASSPKRPAASKRPTAAKPPAKAKRPAAKPRK